MNEETALVYSSEHGRICHKCKQPKTNCVCKKQKNTTKGDGVVRVSYETKGRRGKGVTIITGIALDVPELKLFAKQLKTKCGSGGTLKDGVIEIQGDQRTIIMPILQQHGWQVKRCGG
ncbi:MAG: translation initiation factor Sui1 [Desulfuromonas sp.]|nr:translation initiation factor Sui1 [Desulfuromonas sp.]